jgi:hypothetical protein
MVEQEVSIYGEIIGLLIMLMGTMENQAQQEQMVF